MYDAHTISCSTSHVSVQGYNACLQYEKDVDGNKRLVLGICDDDNISFSWKVDRGHLLPLADTNSCLSRSHSSTNDKGLAVIEGCPSSNELDTLPSYTTVARDSDSENFVLFGDNNPDKHPELGALLLAGDVTKRYKVPQWTLSNEHLFEFSVIIPKPGKSHQICFVLGLGTTRKCMTVAGAGSSENWIKSESECDKYFELVCTGC